MLFALFKREGRSAAAGCELPNNLCAHDRRAAPRLWICGRVAPKARDLAVKRGLPGPFPTGAQSAPRGAPAHHTAGASPTRNPAKTRTGRDRHLHTSLSTSVDKRSSNLESWCYARAPQAPPRDQAGGRHQKFRTLPVAALVA